MTKVFACGNAHRGDDGAGPAVAERLGQLGIEVGMAGGDPLTLLDYWNPTDKVILIDATVTGAPVGTIRVWDSLPAYIPGSTTASSHGFDLRKAIELAQALGRLPARLRMYGIEAGRFDAGAPICSRVEEAIEAVVDRIAADIQMDEAEPESLAYPPLKAI
jgi:hydrogenase maturation protease